MKRLCLTTVPIIFLFLGVKAQVVDVITTGISKPRNFELLGNDLYFSESRINNNPNTGKISKIDITATNPVVENIVTGLAGPIGIRLIGNELYVAEHNNLKLSKIDISIANPTAVEIFSFLPDPNTGIFIYPETMVNFGNALYLNSYSPMFSSGIYKVDIGIDPVAVENIVYFDFTSNDLYTNSISGTALDGNILYFSHTQYFGTISSATGKISKIDISSTNPVVEEVVSGINNPYQLEIVGNYLYFSLFQNGKIQKINLNDANPTIEDVIQGLSGPSGMKVVGNDLYIAQFLSNKISKLDVSNDLALSIDEFAAPKFTIYPNPTSNYIQVKELNATKAYKVYNVLGVELMSGIISNTDQIDVSNLKNGLYFLKIEGYSQKKFIKK
ncbi:MAG: T9SS type A sorting domain-containing protein [Bacteroidota bacterium]